MAELPVRADSKSQSPGFGMRLTIAGISKKFPSVRNISTEILGSWMETGEITATSSQSSMERDTTHSASVGADNLILLDARPLEEYQIGHIPGAVRVDYEAGVDALLATVTKLPKDSKLDDKIVVCYCSVGYRSSMVAQKLVQFYKTKEGTGNIDNLKVYNLEGSVFKWANEGRTMVDGNNLPTRCTHPYNAVFGKLLNKDLRKTSINQ